MRISISQIKTATASLSKWAGSYILWIKDDFSPDALALGNMFEHKLITGKDDYEQFMQNVQEKEKVLADYDALIYNAKGLELPKWDYQMRIDGELFGVPFLWFADIADDECIYDIKTISKTSAISWTYPNMRSGMTYMEEYELQMRAYMKVTGYKKSQIIAVGKFLYKDEKHDHVKIDIEWSDDLDKRMTERFHPIVKKMQDLYLKHAHE